MEEQQDRALEAMQSPDIEKLAENGGLLREEWYKLWRLNLKKRLTS